MRETHHERAELFKIRLYWGSLAASSDLEKIHARLVDTPFRVGREVLSKQEEDRKPVTRATEGFDVVRIKMVPHNDCQRCKR